MGKVQIVIEIDDKAWMNEKSIREVAFEYEKGCAFDRAIREGLKQAIVLPKNHGRLIDEKDIFPLYHCTSEVYCDHKDCATCQFHSVAEYELDNVPTLIEEVYADDT